VVFNLYSHLCLILVVMLCNENLRTYCSGIANLFLQSRCWSWLKASVLLVRWNFMYKKCVLNTLLNEALSTHRPKVDF